MPKHEGKVTEKLLGSWLKRFRKQEQNQPVALCYFIVAIYSFIIRADLSSYGSYKKLQTSATMIIRVSCIVVYITYKYKQNILLFYHFSRCTSTAQTISNILESCCVQPAWFMKDMAPLVMETSILQLQHYKKLYTWYWKCKGEHLWVCVCRGRGVSVFQCLGAQEHQELCVGQEALLGINRGRN